MGGAAALVAVVLAGSLLSSRLWGDKTEKAAMSGPLVYSPGMTAAQFAQANDLPREVAAASFANRVGGFPFERQDLPPDGLRASVERELALYNEHASKNWIKIAVKFAMWAAFLMIVFPLLRRGALTGAPRNAAYLAAALLFGVALGSDPSPMGTVKDAIVMYGDTGALFPPRFIALAVFLLFVVLANKFICSWGCQLGVLQDLLFRLGRGSELRQYKPSFRATNTVRVLVFIAILFSALLFGTDIIEPVDPFKIYNPLALSVFGGLFLTAVLAASLVVYRPWCHLACPFGLVGWLFEKISVYRITVNYSVCVACGACERACPSTVMGAILKRDRVIPDCFSCGDCLAACPSKAVSFCAEKREKPPAGKFAGQNK